MVEEKINELRTKYATLAGILERIHNMDLRDTAIGLLGIDAMESLLKLRAIVILSFLTGKNLSKSETEVLKHAEEYVAEQKQQLKLDHV